jgi:hypothetical protein
MTLRNVQPIDMLFLGLSSIMNLARGHYEVLDTRWYTGKICARYYAQRWILYCILQVHLTPSSRVHLTTLDSMLLGAVDSVHSALHP